MNAWGTWPPPAAPSSPIIIGHEGSFLVSIANGASGTLITAPPAGYMNLVIAEAHNAHATLTLAFQLSDSDGNQAGNIAFAAGASAFPITSSFPLIVTSALTASVNGGTGGTPCQFRGTCTQVPIPPGMVRTALVLTNAFQTIAGVVPVAGIMIGYRNIPNYAGNDQGIIVFNGDTATCQLQLRLTRGIQTFTWIAASSIAISSRSAPFPLALLAGDLLEAKLTAAPSVAGSVILRAQYMPAQIAS